MSAPEPIGHPKKLTWAATCPRCHGDALWERTGERRDSNDKIDMVYGDFRCLGSEPPHNCPWAGKTLTQQQVLLFLDDRTTRYEQTLNQQPPRIQKVEAMMDLMDKIGDEWVEAQHPGIGLEKWP